MRILEGMSTGALVTGGINPTVWEAIYNEWERQHGRVLVSDPQQKTCPTGNALGRILYLLGAFVSFASMAIR